MMQAMKEFQKAMTAAWTSFLLRLQTVAGCIQMIVIWTYVNKPCYL